MHYKNALKIDTSNMTKSQASNIFVWQKENQNKIYDTVYKLEKNYNLGIVKRNTSQTGEIHTASGTGKSYWILYGTCLGFFPVYLPEGLGFFSRFASA